MVLVHRQAERAKGTKIACTHQAEMVASLVKLIQQKCQPDHPRNHIFLIKKTYMIKFSKKTIYFNFDKSFTVHHPKHYTLSSYELIVSESEYPKRSLFNFENETADGWWCWYRITSKYSNALRTSKTCSFAK